MDGKNSAGRRISLLNDDDLSQHSHSLHHPAAAARPPSLEPSTFRSRTSSYNSSPCLSPQTPQLSRSDSTDSAPIINMPSPITPSYPFDDALHSPRPQPGTLPYFSLAQYQPQHAKMPAVPFVPPAFANHLYVRHPPPDRQPMPSANPKTKKNQYPCPLAKAFGCNDYFTTSGHAARHAKKHTGKKDAICPDCKKAFTRKDNMEQHRRTHSNGRNPRGPGPGSGPGPKDADDARKKMKPTPARPKPSPIQSTSLVDPALPASPASTTASAVHDDYAVSPYPDSAPVYPPPERFQLNPPSDDAYRLHTLAFAASGEKRKFEA